VTQTIHTEMPDAEITIICYRSILIIQVKDEDEPSVWVPVMGLQAISVDFAKQQIDAYVDAV